MTPIPATRALIVAGLLAVAACTSTPPESPAGSTVAGPTAAPASADPAPTATIPIPSPSQPSDASPSPVPASPAPSPVATEPPTTDAVAYDSTSSFGDVLFAKNGRVVVVEQDWSANRSQVSMLDPNGVPMAGWPWSAGDTGSPIATAVVDPKGGIWVAVRGASGIPESYTWDLHHVSNAGKTSPGFPVKLPDVPFCSLAAAADGTALAVCEGESASGQSTTTIRRVHRDGTTAAGWPRRFDGSATIAGVRPDGGVVVGVSRGNRSIITVLRANGKTASGWPRTLKHEGGTVSVDPSGRIRVTSHTYAEDACAPVLTTTFTVLRGDGTTVGGWPITVKGWASDPVVRPDGSSVVVTQDGRAIARSLRGALLAGWPVRRVALSFSCGDGTSPVSAGREGIVIAGGKAVTLLRMDGSSPSGWPAKLAVPVANACPSCTPGSGATLEPAVGRRGVWVAEYLANGRPRVVGIARDGSRPASWGRTIGNAGDQLSWVRIAPNGRVWAALEVANPSEDGMPLGRLVPIADDAHL